MFGKLGNHIEEQSFTNRKYLDYAFNIISSTEMLVFSTL